MFNKLRILEVMGEYNKQPHQHGMTDCNLMLLQALGHDITQIPQYETPIQGRTALRSYLGVRSMKQYLLENGFRKIDPVLISDFDVILSGVNCSFYIDGKMFGVHDGSFCLLPYQHNNKFEVFRWA